MTEPTPAPTPAPEHEGPLARLRAWFEADVEPRLLAVEADLPKIKALAPQVAELAGIVEKIADSADPTAAPEVKALADDAGKVVAKVAEILAGLGIAGM